MFANKQKTPGGYKLAPHVANQLLMTSEPARVRTFWATLSLVLTVTFGPTPACGSPALTFSIVIYFAMKYKMPISLARGHKEVRKSTGHIMVSTRYSRPRLVRPGSDGQNKWDENTDIHIIRDSNRDKSSPGPTTRQHEICVKTACLYCLSAASVFKI